MSDTAVGAVAAIHGTDDKHSSSSSSSKRKKGKKEKKEKKEKKHSKEKKSKKDKKERKRSKVDKQHRDNRNNDDSSDSDEDDDHDDEHTAVITTAAASAATDVARDNSVVPAQPRAQLALRSGRKPTPEEIAAKRAALVAKRPAPVIQSRESYEEEQKKVRVHADACVRPCMCGCVGCSWLHVWKIC